LLKAAQVIKNNWEQDAFRSWQQSIRERQLPFDESTLIDKCQILDPIADDDDINGKTDPFEMRPDSVNSETPHEIIAMIKFSGLPWLQENQ
jgi:hypothetical protein